MNYFEMDQRRRRILTALLVCIVFVQASAFVASAQNLGEEPQFGVAVQGQNAGQVEGAFLNVVNWIGNVICPLGAGLCIAMAVVAYMHGRGMVRWVIGAAGLLAVSALTRLLEAFILKGHQI